MNIGLLFFYGIPRAAFVLVALLFLFGVHWLVGILAALILAPVGISFITDCLIVKERPE